MSLVFLLCTLGVYGQEKRIEVCVDFRVNKTNLDSSFSDNAIRVQEIISFLQEIRQDSTVRIVEVSFCGAASPEGSYQLNRKLAQGRLSSLEKLVRQEVEIPDSVITRNDSYIPWDILKSLVKDSELTHKEEVLAILEEESRLVDYHHPDTHIDNRIEKIKQLDEGRVWQQINRQFFSSMRNACTVIVTYRDELQTEPEVISQPVEPGHLRFLFTIPLGTISRALSSSALLPYSLNSAIGFIRKTMDGSWAHTSVWHISTLHLMVSIDIRIITAKPLLWVVV